MVRDGLFVDTADGDFLTAVGQNFGIPRPAASPFDDETYRKVVMALAWLPKHVLSTLYYLMTAVFGSQHDIVAQGHREWRIYEVNPNEFIVELPLDLIGTSNDDASYLHGFAGAILSGASTTTFTVQGDATAAAVNLVGLYASAYISGAWEAQPISTATYSASTGITTIVVSPAFSGAPDPGASFFVDVPGDGTSSYRGDYLAPIWYAQGTSTSVGVDGSGNGTLTDSGLTMTTNQYVDYWLRLAEGGLYYRITANTATTFTLAVKGAPPGGGYAVVKSPVDADEDSDTSSTPPHADRVYIAGDGPYEIVAQYLLKIVRASGVVVRLEKI